MAHNIFNARDYIPTEKDIFLVDTNILVYLFTPFTELENFFGRQYEDFVFKRDPRLVITSMVLSEFIHTNLKNKYSIYKEINDVDIRYKEYRKLPEFEAEVEYLKNVTDRQILKIVDRIDDDFMDLDVMACYSGFAENFDFSDRYHIELAKKNDLKILTNDFDFSAASDVDIVTTNPSFFKHKR